MLKKLSKQGEYTHFLIISIILLIFYFTPQVPLTQNLDSEFLGPIGKWLVITTNSNIAITKLVMIVVMVFISLYINRLAVTSELFPKQSFLSATLLILFFLFSPSLPEFAIAIATLLFLSFSLGSMISMFGKQYPYLQVLNASMAVAVSSMIIPHAILFIVFIWFGFLTYSVSTWREWVISIIGLAIPYLYMVFAYFWNNNLEYILKLYESLYFTKFDNFTMPSSLIIVSLALIFIIYTISAFNFTNEASDKIISIRKRMWLIFQFSAICIVTMVLASTASYMFLMVLFIPVTVMIAYLIHNHKRSRMFDILILSFVISILINRIFA